MAGAVCPDAGNVLLPQLDGGGCVFDGGSVSQASTAVAHNPKLDRSATLKMLFMVLTLLFMVLTPRSRPYRRVDSVRSEERRVGKECRAWWGQWYGICNMI